MKKINQQLIADKLGISRATVSRCFTNHPGINPVTRSKVFQLAASLGYQHMETRTGEGPANKEARSFGVLVCESREDQLHGVYQKPGFELLAGISEYAQLSGRHLDLNFVEAEDTSLESDSYVRIAALRARKWDGVILINAFPQSIVNELQRLYPLVSLATQYADAPVDTVDINHALGISMMLNRLYDNGHRRIGFLSKASEFRKGWMLRRYAAFVEKMTQLDMLVNRKDVLNIHPHRMMSELETHEYALGRMKDGVTAWVCAADAHAYELLRYLGSQGLRIPEDVSITGFDGYSPPDWSPELTTAVIPYQEIGFAGGRRLERLIEKRSETAQEILVSCTAREGATVGAVPKLCASS